MPSCNMFHQVHLRGALWVAITPSLKPLQGVVSLKFRCPCGTSYLETDFARRQNTTPSSPQIHPRPRSRNGANADQQPPRDTHIFNKSRCAYTLKMNTRFSTNYICFGRPSHTRRAPGLQGWFLDGKGNRYGFQVIVVGLAKAKTWNT